MPPPDKAQAQSDIHIHISADPLLVRALDRMNIKLDQLITAQGGLAMGMDALDAAVSNMESTVATSSDVKQSASSLLDQLSQIIRDNAGDPAALQQLADRISSATTTEGTGNEQLAAAVAANTPGATEGGPSFETPPEGAPA